MQCIYPDCTKDAELHVLDKQDPLWCHEHWGLFPHKCVTCGTATVQYNDEPWCFKCSPDKGSSQRGYSAYEEAMKKVSND